FLPLGWQISPTGTILSLILGELHVIWRHVSVMNWQTPKVIAVCCRLLFITTPEIHWLHHKNANLAYGDIFTFYDRPAQKWKQFLTRVKFSFQS
ncbi:MAG: sterol desaturase, partial [Xenococcus sp. (in: cyanobacteria)]